MSDNPEGERGSGGTGDRGGVDVKDVVQRVDSKTNDPDSVKVILDAAKGVGQTPNRRALERLKARLEEK